MTTEKKAKAVVDEPTPTEAEEPAPTKVEDIPKTDPPPKRSEMEAWKDGVAANAAEAERAAKAEADAKAAAAKATKAKRQKRGDTWRETRWGTHPQYTCKFCHYSTFDLEAMAQHADAHTEED